MSYNLNNHNSFYNPPPSSSVSASSSFFPASSWQHITSNDGQGSYHQPEPLIGQTSQQQQRNATNSRTPSSRTGRSSTRSESAYRSRASRAQPQVSPYPTTRPVDYEQQFQSIGLGVGTPDYQSTGPSDQYGWQHGYGYPVPTWGRQGPAASGSGIVDHRSRSFAPGMNDATIDYTAASMANDIQVRNETLLYSPNVANASSYGVAAGHQYQQPRNEPWSSYLYPQRDHLAQAMSAETQMMASLLLQPNSTPTIHPAQQHEQQQQQQQLPLHHERMPTTAYPSPNPPTPRPNATLPLPPNPNGRRASTTSSTSPRYLCDICGTSCSRRNDVERHRFTQHSGWGKPYLCLACGATFNRRDKTREHCRVRHGQQSGEENYFDPFEFVNLT